MSTEKTLSFACMHLVMRHPPVVKMVREYKDSSNGIKNGFLYYFLYRDRSNDRVVHIMPHQRIKVLKLVDRSHRSLRWSTGTIA